MLQLWAYYWRHLGGQKIAERSHEGDAYSKVSERTGSDLPDVAKEEIRKYYEYTKVRYR
jgi:hypothetical protein